MDRVSVDRLGFTLLHEPKTDSVESLEAHTVNVVFVHGLRGNPQKTWEYVPSSPPTKPSVRPDSQGHSRRLFRIFRSSDSSAQDDSPALSTAGDSPCSVYWPAELLPITLPNCRIWTYGYNADAISGFFKQNNQNSILKHANDFMVKLERTLRDKRPIIFVAHSLGGIIVKRALSQMASSLHDSQRRLIRRVSAAIFCGCPHRGSDAASWALLASQLVAVAMADSNSKLLSDLEVDSEILDLIQEDFLKTLRTTLSESKNSEFRIHSFLESRPVTGIRGLNCQVVDTFSSKLGWPDETFESIDADHSDMVKEAGVKDISSVLRDLENLAKDSEQFNSSNSNPYEPIPEESDSKPYEHLHIFFSFDYRAILNQIPKRHPNSCSWILDAEAFSNWSRGEGSSVFWLYGYPGRGKSVIAKYLVESSLGSDQMGPPLKGNSHSNNPIVIFFFCSYRDTQAQMLKNLLSSFIYQLLSEKPELGVAVRERHETLSLPLEEALHNLWNILEDVITHIPNIHQRKPATGAALIPPPKNLYFIVDALDELNRSDWTPFLERIFGLLKRTHRSFRLIITSRRELDIERKMQTAGAWSFDLGSSKENRSDLAGYVRDTVSIFGRENNFGHDTTLAIISELVIKADAMFLWATLAWSFFTEGVGIWTKSILKQRLRDLQHLPPGMESLYYRILSKVDRKYQADLWHSLQLIVVAARPLSVDEFAVALALRERPLKKQDLDVRLNIEAFFRRVCPHLIKIDQFGKVTLVHLSCKEYLLEIPVINDSPNPFHIDLAAANFELGLDCLSYIALDDVLERLGSPEARPSFLGYSARYWLHHLRGRNDRVNEIWPYFEKLYPKGRIYAFRHSDIIIDLWTHGLHHILEPTAAMLENDYLCDDLNVMNERGDHLIHIVVPEIHQFPLEDAKFLSGIGVDINGRTHLGQTLLHRCVAKWQDERERLHLSAELQDHINIHIEGWRDAKGKRLGSRADVEEPLSAEKTCQELLTFQDIDPNAMDKFGYTPLSFAIHHGLEDIFTILLSHQNLDKLKASSALHVAGKEGVLWAVEHLLNRGVPTWQKTKYGETALQLAASKGHLRVLKLLASKSLPHVLNAKDCYGWTVVHHAVTSGNDQMVLWLASNFDFDFSLRDRHGRRAVAFAAAYGTVTMLKVLLNRSPRDLTHLDSFGNTLFHLAAAGNNVQNLSFLATLKKPLLINCLGPNIWGKTVIDLAPALETETYLLGLGFEHSPQYFKHRYEISRANRQARARARSAIVPSTRMNGLVTVPKSDSNQSENPDVSSSYVDMLGQSMDTIYAIDAP